MNRTRLDVLLSLARGLLAAIAMTLVCMTGIAALAVGLHASDQLIHALNQLLKCLSILVGTLAAVGVGGRRGFVTGMALAIIYMALGFGLAVWLGGQAFAVPDLLGEMLIGAALGAAAGAVLSNLTPRRRAARP